MLPIRRTATAKRDIKRVLKWTIDELGKEQAERYAQLIEEGFDRIARYPWLGRLRLKNREIRFLQIKQPGRDAAHFLVYEVHPQFIAILRLMHERQDEVKALAKWL